MENDRDHENELLVKVIKYFGEHGLLDDPKGEVSHESHAEQAKEVQQTPE